MKKLLGVLLVLIMAVVLVGCAPKDSAAAKTKLEKKDYVVVVLDKNDGAISRTALALIGDDVQASVTASKKTDDGTIALTAVLFENSKAAKAFYDSSKNDEGKTNLVKSGNWVIYGDEKAVKDFK